MREMPIASDGAPILVVDDDPKILQLVRMYLEREGLRVITVADGVAGVTAIRERARLLPAETVLSRGAGRPRESAPATHRTARGAGADIAVARRSRDRPRPS